jgi:nicotinate-nucleotide adenylyltransferase
MRIGIYGGSFNPIHFGHLRAAVEVREQASLDEVWFVPAHLPPHKDPRHIAPAEHRLQMVRAAVATSAGLVASDVELYRQGPSYTVDTLRSLRIAKPALEIAFILGLDTFREMHTWSRFEALVAEFDLLVTSRPPDRAAREGAESLLDGPPIAALEPFWYDQSQSCFVHQSGSRLQVLPVTALEISASDIRNRVNAGHSIDFLTPPVVVDYIRQHGLYRS